MTVNKAYITFFNLAALFILSFLAVDIFYGIVLTRFQHVNIREEKTRKAPTKKALETATLGDFNVIAERNIFGSSGKPVEKGPEMEKEPKVDDIEKLEPTSLKIVLVGTVNGPRQNSFAVIEETAKKQQGLYKTGDTVLNATIRRILRGKVVLRVGEKDEILEMTQNDIKSGKGDRASQSASGEGYTITIGQKDLQDSINNINQLLTEVRIRPNMSGGKPDGLALTYMKQGSIFTKLGLKKGDIITGLNGKPINSPEDAFAFYKSLETGSDLSLSVRRNGKQEVINYQFR